MNWNISAMNCQVQEGEYQDVVYCVHWQCSDTQEINGQSYFGSVYSTCSVPAPTDSFTPYADLTQEQVLGWIWANGVDKNATETAVNAQIQAQAYPVTVTPPLPWAA